MSLDIQLLLLVEAQLGHLFLRVKPDVMMTMVEMMMIIMMT